MPKDFAIENLKLLAKLQAAQRLADLLCPVLDRNVANDRSPGKLSLFLCMFLTTALHTVCLSPDLWHCCDRGMDLG